MAPLTDKLEDGQRDALAILAAALREDCEAIGTIVANCETPIVIGALASMLFAALTDRLIDPADWVAAEQARLRW